MTVPVLVFVNEQPVRVPAEARMADAVRAMDEALATKLAEGAAQLTDGRGIALEPTAAVFPGAIVRVVVRARPRSTESNAHP